MKTTDALGVLYETLKAKLPAEPTPINTRTGCRVAWKTYLTIEDAELAAKHARLLAHIMAQRGYEWGYQCPGDIEATNDGYVVTWP